MATTQYIGSRYVPILANPVEWSNTKTYEPLTIVTHEGNSYTSRQFVPVGVDITNEQFWAPTGNYNAQIEQYRQDVANTNDELTAIKNIIPFGDYSPAYTISQRFQDVDDTIAAIYTSPDDYEGSDNEKLQAALDAIVNVGGVVVINRPYNITQDIIINNDSNVHTMTYVVGLGKNAKINMIGTFKSENPNYGNITFNNIMFSGRTNLFDLTNVIRLFFTNCMFVNINNVLYSPTRYAQSLYFNNCMFRQIQDHVAYINGEAYDVRFNSCLVEASNNFMYLKYGCGVTVNNNCIEGLSGYVLKYRTGYSINFCFNYFEMNEKYFIQDDVTGTIRNLTIGNNYIAENREKTIIHLPNNLYARNSCADIHDNVIPDDTAPTILYQIDNPANAAVNLRAVGNRAGANGNAKITTTETLEKTVTREFEIYPNREYETYVLFGNDGTYSTGINLPINPSYDIQLTKVNLTNLGDRDVSKYQASIKRNIGFTIMVNDASERLAAANTTARITLKMVPGIYNQ